MELKAWLEQAIKVLLFSSLICICGACEAKGGKLTPERLFDDKMLELASAIEKDDAAKIVTAIRSGANPNGFGKEGITPLIFACAVGEKRAMVALLENGADPNLHINATHASEGMKGRSAVTIVAGAPDNEYLKILLDYGGDVNAKDTDGEPILITMLFMSPRNYEGIKMLLERGADMEATDSGGCTLLMNMALLADFEHMYYMLQRGADFRRKDIGGADISHDVFNYHIDKDKFPQGYEWQRKCKEFLLAHGMKDPGPLKPKVQTPEEQEEWRQMYNKALEADMKRRGR